MVMKSVTPYLQPMNHEPPVPCVESFLRRKLSDLKQFAQREPGKAVAAAIGVGLIINLLPTRLVAGTTTMVATAMVRPFLLSLGVTKAMELCCQKNSTPISE